MVKNGVNDTRKSHSKDTLKNLIEVAIDLFSTNGFNGTSVRDIAKKLNMSMAALYHYFPTKESLYFSIFLDTIKLMVEELHKATEQDLPPLDRFKALLRSHLALGANHQKEFKLSFLEEEYFSKENKKISKQYQSEVMSIYLQELRKLQEIGYSKDQSPTMLALNIFGIINWFVRWYNPKKPKSPEQLIDNIIEFIITGVAGKLDENSKS